MAHSRKARGEISFRVEESVNTAGRMHRHSPLLYWLIVLGVIPAILLPLGCFAAFILARGLLHANLLKYPALAIGLVCSLLAGVGTANLYMLPVQRLCERTLRQGMPGGLPSPLYLGHTVTLVFLGGFGGLAMICAALQMRMM